MSHKFTGESIYSFTCSKCGNWWSYAHEKRKYDLKLPEALRKMFCPHCGFRDEVVEKKSWGWGAQEWSHDYPA